MVCQHPISCRTIRALDGVGRFGPRVTRVKLKAPMGLLFFWTGAIQLRWVSGGLWGPFLLEGRVDTALHDRLIALFEPVLKEIGYELVEVEYVSGQGGGTLRIYIDHPEGIDVDDCGDASHVLSELLDANDPFPGNYSLEVSSPGLDRILRTPAHFAQFVEHRVKVELKVARDGRKRYTGTLRRTDGESIEMDVDNFSVSIKLAEIGRARLAPL
jgi:ribosome maturation factor RimP